MSKKFNFSDVIDDVKESLRKEKKSELLDNVNSGIGLADASKNPKDYVVMPQWWEMGYGVLGLPFGKLVQIAGDSDVGKTSLCITAMKSAQEQGYGIIYVETEGKTSKQDLLDWGVDPNGIILINTNITEKAFDLSFRSIESFFSKYPNEKLLYIFDSFGNTISLHDENLDMVESNQKVGGAAKTNRLGLGRLLALMDENPIAVLIVNYSDDNIGTVGKTQAGGKALKFYTMIGINAQRTGDWIRTINKEKVKAGAFVKWSTFKNHYQKSVTDAEGNKRFLPKDVSLKISAKGIEVMEGGNDEE